MTQEKLREIKFRGKRADNGKWVYGDLQYGLPDRNTYVMGIQVYPETVGQYTGLCDRNGVEIYEGDIVSVTNQEEEYIDSGCGVGKVEYLKEFGFYNVSNIENSIHELIFQDYVVEVIGNIHDRPNESKTKERCNCKRLSDSVNESQTKALENQTKGLCDDGGKR